MDEMDLHLEKELMLLMGCNGDLNGMIAEFRENHPDPKHRKRLVKLALSELLKLSLDGPAENDPQDVMEVFVTKNHRLLDILTEIGAGGVYDRLLDYSANISKLPIAKDWRGNFCEWASKLKVATAEVMVMCRSRKNSASPPY